jgi:hypothetical protein
LLLVKNKTKSFEKKVWSFFVCLLFSNLGRDKEKTILCVYVKALKKFMLVLRGGVFLIQTLPHTLKPTANRNFVGGVRKFG